MPQDQKVLAANHNAIVAQASDTLHVPISLKHANRISVKGGRIERFVSDPAQLEIRHDAPSGALFVVPLTTEAAPLYIVTQSGVTHALMLSPKDRIGAQNLEIREPSAAAKELELSLTVFRRKPPCRKSSVCCPRLPKANPNGLKVQSKKPPISKSVRCVNGAWVV